MQYADFAVWQRSWLTGDVLDGQLGYWRGALAGAPVLDLPTDRPRPPVRSTAGAVDPVHQSRPRSPASCAASPATTARPMFMTLLAAYLVLLGRYSGQDDIVVGTPVANRNRAETEDLIGFFVNTLVLRTDLSGDPTFTELLARVRQTALGAYGHQDVPFEQLVDAARRPIGTGPGRPCSRPASTTARAAPGSAPGPAGQLGDDGPAPQAGPATPALATAGDRAASGPHGEVRPAVTLADAGAGLTGTVEYATALFDRGHRRPDGRPPDDPAAGGRGSRKPGACPPCRSLPPPSATSCRAWNDTVTPVPALDGVHDLITGRAAASPGRGRDRRRRCAP